MYHLDLSQYQDTLETLHHEDNHHQIQEARLNSHRSSGGGAVDQQNQS